MLILRCNAAEWLDSMTRIFSFKTLKYNIQVRSLSELMLPNLNKLKVGRLGRRPSNGIKHISNAGFQLEQF